jgi:RNA polymerase sigma-70 factor (ECF subfamily)
VIQANANRCEVPQGRTDAFEKAALMHLDAVYRVARYMTRNEHEADDLVQETYFRAFRAFDRFDMNTNCKAWLLKILSNLNVDRFSRIRVRRENVCYEDVKAFLGTADGSRSGSPAGGNHFADEYLDDEVGQAVRALPEAFREPLLLSAVEGLSYAEIARVLGCPIGTVMSRIFRGRHLLRKWLAGYAVVNGLRA